ncbi:IMPACT family protein [Pelagibacterium lacus]|uniref:YigZ family protein n=1 Tax=Pelagibacterium lacus TaxID=2282655 RepID=A0A369W353_9HYPH|nr:YigZ family protein [Pelagibacterium lacus]RDE08479.1 YigZ family protein [Pelagibacterium lacus]
MTNLKTLVAPVTARQEIKKSRFVAFAAPVADEAEAKEFIASHSDTTATHNCWAWHIGQSYRFSDDGEPGGTAGRPILQAIEGQGLDRVAVLVTRWFGGVLLGSGGLVRAYGGTAALALRGAETMELVETVPALIACPFGDLSLVQARLGALAGVEMQAPHFTASGAELPAAIPKAMVADVTRLVADLTSGRATLMEID